MLVSFSQPHLYKAGATFVWTTDMSFISFNLWIVFTYKYVTWHIYKRNFCNHWHFNAWSLETFCFKTSEILHWEEPYLSASQVGGSGIERGDGGPWIVLTYKYVTWHIYISLTFHCWSFETFCLKKSEMWHWDEPYLGANLQIKLGVLV